MEWCKYALRASHREGYWQPEAYYLHTASGLLFYRPAFDPNGHGGSMYNTTYGPEERLRYIETLGYAPAIPAALMLPEGL